MHGEVSTAGDDADPDERGETVLYGQSLACLCVDDTERLSLAQISNTLLRRYRYNDIHNRRVALGITCAQCTPGQLEVLRCAGAMPAASRRCGIITKREAERLVKSFIEDSHPPNLPPDFVFSVRHSCGWGCVGDFTPARYNSSRAKCIKCGYCSEYFSPNKFLFHFHRSPGSIYRHPDAANFNSWRRHLRLAADQPSERLVHMWEDVKATFNSGRPHDRATSSSSEPSRPTVFTPFKPYPSVPEATRVPFPAARMIPPPAFALGVPPESWMDHRRVAPNPFGVLFAGHFYSSLVQPSAFRLPLFAVHNTTMPRMRSGSTGAGQLGPALDPALQSAFQAVSAQREDAVARDSSRVPPSNLA
ncbi:hypothetical protein NP493_313g00000 [Ridgeia piscesae]|uniref:c-SKI SMAD4-binding domain-containing protein n=1 Tax=Ridgeia piscesae TaxID=27915 RepID=A0AAD9L4W3_RIDPI|nr:hypothetical protein NP493_313g00000 [Ridgeia piscesae]